MKYNIVISSLLFILSIIHPSFGVTHQEKLNRKLLKAVRHNNYEQVINLLQFGADINTHDTRIFTRGCSGYTPLHYAVRYNYKELAQLLLDYGAQVNCTDNAGSTPLHYAARNNNTDFVELLLAYNAFVDARDSYGQTPLHVTFNPRTHAARVMFNALGTISAHYTTAELLLSYGANINEQSNMNQTPLHYAAMMGLPLLVELFLIHGANVTLQDTFGANALYYTNAFRAIQLLLDFGATDEHWTHPEKSISTLTYFNLGINPLADCKRYRKEQTFSYQYLLKQIHTPTRQAFQKAIEEGYYTLVKLFIRNGMLVELRDLFVAKAQYIRHKNHQYRYHYKAIGRLLCAYLQLFGIHDETQHTTTQHTDIHKLLTRIFSHTSHTFTSSNSHNGPISKRGILGSNYFTEDIVRAIARYIA